MGFFDLNTCFNKSKKMISPPSDQLQKIGDKKFTKTLIPNLRPLGLLSHRGNKSILLGYINEVQFLLYFLNFFFKTLVARDDKVVVCKVRG